MALGRVPIAASRRRWRRSATPPHPETAPHHRPHPGVGGSSRTRSTCRGWPSATRTGRSTTPPGRASRRCAGSATRSAPGSRSCSPTHWPTTGTVTRTDPGQRVSYPTRGRTLTCQLEGLQRFGASSPRARRQGSSRHGHPDTPRRSEQARAAAAAVPNEDAPSTRVEVASKFSGSCRECAGCGTREDRWGSARRQRPPGR